MFLSTVIPLTPLAPPARIYNHHAHAFFLDLVHRADAALAQSLHEACSGKPFTVALLPLPAKAGEGLGVRVTAFEPRLAQLLAQTILPNLPREIRLGNTTFVVGTPITDRAAHPWAGISSAEDLVAKWFQKDDLRPSSSVLRRLDRVTLEFATPTAHRQIHRNVLFPMPVQLWGGWLRAWNAYAQPAFEEDLIARVAQDVVLSRYHLKTTIVDFGTHRTAGWVGRATFHYLTNEPALWRVLNLLADFAFFCGTGYKNNAGNGDDAANRMTKDEGQKTNDNLKPVTSNLEP